VDWDCSIDVDMAWQETETDNVGMISGSFCDDSITFDDLASCLTFCVEEGIDNLECGKDVCSPHFPLILHSPAMTASPWATPTPHSVWAPAAAYSYAPAMYNPLCKVMACSGMIASIDNNCSSPVLTASPQWTPRPVDLEVPLEEEPKTVLRLVDLL